MSANLQELHALQTWVGQAVGHAFTEALAITLPAGNSPSWAGVCKGFGVAQVSERERGEIRAAQKPLRGAPQMEVQQVLLTIYSRAAERQASLSEHDMNDAESAASDRIERLLNQGIDGLLDAYRRQIVPRIAAAGMFANVLSHAGSHPDDDATAHCYQCANCGAPRLSEGVMACEFCGHALFRDTAGPAPKT